MKKGFTLIELLIVIAIIGLLASIAFVALNSARKDARDTKRLADMKQIVLALDLYYEKNGAFPANTDSECASWDAGFYDNSGDIFIQPLVTDGQMASVPGDPLSSDACAEFCYKYYRYDAGTNGCDISRGAYFVLGIKNMETSGNPSPGWSCPGTDWQPLFDWVTGGFEN